MALSAKEKQAVSSYRVAKKTGTTVSKKPTVKAPATTKVVAKAPATQKATKKASTPAVKKAPVQAPKVSAYDQKLNAQKADYNSPYNIQQRQQDMGAQGMTGIEQSLRDGQSGYMEQQKSSLGHARDQQISDLQSGYSQAVQDGEMSVREAQDAFDQQKTEIDQQAYLDSQATNLTAQDRGIQNSMQMLGLQQGDNARHNTNVNGAMSERDARILGIRDRLKSLGAQNTRDITNANANYDYGIAGAQGQSDMQLNQQLAQMQQENLNLNRQQGFQLDSGALQQGYAKDNLATQQGYTKDNLATEQKYNQQNAKTQQGYNQQNAKTQQVYNQRNLKTQQNYVKDNAKTQQKYTMEQIAKKFGYDLKTMNTQQKNELTKLAKQQGYNVQNAQTNQKYSLAQIASQNKMDLKKMTLNQKYDLIKLAKANGYDVASDERKYKQASDQADKESKRKIAQETSAYKLAVQRELAKYQKGTNEYDIRKKQFDDGLKAMTTEIVKKAQTDAVIKFNLGTPVPKPNDPGTKRSFWETQGHQNAEMKQYKLDLASYERYQKALKDPNSLFK